MKAIVLFALGWGLVSPLTASAQLPVLKRSDVVFMYQAGRQMYQDYGATVLAWGGKPTTRSLAESQGLKFFGSVGMVTEFGRYRERFPQTYEQGLCREVEGRSYRVPWLTDLQHQGVPYWWCCTRQPLFRQYLAERVTETVQAGAQGVHIDDHLGTAGGIWEGGCFCDRCVAEFPEYLRALPPDELARIDVPEPGRFNFREAARAWLAEQPQRKVQQHPLWPHWRVYQFRGAAQFMAELRALAARTAGRPVPIGANACLLWGPHLSDYSSVDLFSAEIEHQAATLAFQDAPLVAYRLADAVGRPLAATASGGDWAFIKEHNRPGLVRGWSAFGYAAGHSLMAPNRQWCHTPQKGTHWYEGPKEKYAPLYQFVRQNAGLFDDYQNHSDLTVAMAQRTFDRDAAKVIALCRQLAAAHVSFRFALGGDAIVDHPLPAEELRRAARLLVLSPEDFLPADRAVLSSMKHPERYETIEQALAKVTPVVRVESAAAASVSATNAPATSGLRVLPRVKPGFAVLHLVNWTYDAARDAETPIRDVRLKLDLAALGVAGATEARCHVPGAAPLRLPIEASRLTVPELGLWAVLELAEK